MKTWVSAISLLVAASLGNSQTNGGGSSTPPTLKVTPATVSLRAAAQPSTQTFKGAETGVKTPATSYTWALTGAEGVTGSLGILSSTGVYTPPAVPPVPNNVTVTATDAANKLAGTAVITVLNPAPVISSLTTNNITLTFPLRSISKALASCPLTR